MNDFDLFHRIKQRDRDAFNTLFRLYYTSLCGFSYAICVSHEEAEEYVQEMFIHLWEKAPTIAIDTSVKAYLYTATRNYTLNGIRKKQTELRHLTEYSETIDAEEPPPTITNCEMAGLIQTGIETLPVKCREIFILCKQEGLTYEEVANYLCVSEKTIENQMGIAIRKLREYLHPLLEKLLLFIFFYLLY